MTVDKAIKPVQLPLPIDQCDVCVTRMEIKYSYKCCPLGYNPYLNHPNPKEALCKTGETKD